MTHARPLDRYRKHVDVAGLPDLLHGLPLEHGGQRADLVSHRCRLLELQPPGVLFHLRLQAFEHLVLTALQEARRVADIARVIRLADGAHARPGAAVDLVQQARPRAIGKDGVLAGTQLEHALQDLHALPHSAGAGERPEILMLAVSGTAVIGHAREAMAGQLDERIRLVVAKQDVVARRQRLDQVVLEQQRSASVRTTVVSMRTILATIMAMRGDSSVLLK